MKAAFFRNMVLVLVLGVVGVFDSAAQKGTYDVTKNYYFNEHKPDNVAEALVEMLLMKGMVSETSKHVREIVYQLAILGGDKQMKQKVMKKTRNKAMMDLALKLEKETRFLQETLLPVLLPILEKYNIVVDMDDILSYLPKKLKKDNREIPVKVKYKFYQKTKRGEELPGWKKTLNWVSNKTNAAMDATIGAGLRTLKPIADAIVFPVLKVTPISGYAAVANVTIDLALLANRSNKAMDNTQNFYYDAIIEIDDVRNGLIRQQEDAFETYETTKDIKQLEGVVEKFNKDMDILEEHLDIHSENIIAHYLPAFDISASFRNRILEDIRTVRQWVRDNRRENNGYYEEQLKANHAYDYLAREADKAEEAAYADLTKEGLIKEGELPKFRQYYQKKGNREDFFKAAEDVMGGAIHPKKNPEAALNFYVGQLKERMRKEYHAWHKQQEAIKLSIQKFKEKKQTQEQENKDKEAKQANLELQKQKAIKAVEARKAKEAEEAQKQAGKKPTQQAKNNRPTTNAQTPRQGAVRTPSGQYITPQTLHELYIGSCKVYKCGANYADTEQYLRQLAEAQAPMTNDLQQATNLLSQALQAGQSKVNQQAYIPAAIKMIERDRKKAASTPKASKSAKPAQASKTRKPFDQMSREELGQLKNQDVLDHLQYMYQETCKTHYCGEEYFQSEHYQQQMQGVKKLQQESDELLRMQQGIMQGDPRAVQQMHQQALDHAQQLREKARRAGANKEQLKAIDEEIARAKGQMNQTRQPAQAKTPKRGTLAQARLEVYQQKLRYAEQDLKNAQSMPPGKNRDRALIGAQNKLKRAQRDLQEELAR